MKKIKRVQTVVNLNLDQETTDLLHAAAVRNERSLAAEVRVAVYRHLGAENAGRRT